MCEIKCGVLFVCVYVFLCVCGGGDDLCATCGLNKPALTSWVFFPRLIIVFSQTTALLIKCQQPDTVSAQSCMCELTVAVTTLREEKHKALRPKTYSEKRVNFH